MNEREVYNTLVQYYKDKTGNEVNDTMCFMIISAQVLPEDAIQTGASIVDPDLPDIVAGVPIHQNMAQQSLMYFKDNMQDALNHAQEAAMALHHIREKIGIEALQEIMDSCEDGIQFSERMKGLLEL